MHISDDEFERAIEQVLDDLPERFARVLENVGIVVLRLLGSALQSSRSNFFR